MNDFFASDSLRRATKDLHRSIENTPFADALLNKAISRDAYVGYIRVLSVIHAVLEKHLDTCDHPLVSRVWSDELRRLPLLLADNDSFRRELVPDSLKSIQAAHDAASYIRVIAQDTPISILGCLYVLAGSSKGAMILAPLVSKTLGVNPGRGLSYLSRHGSSGVSEWERAAARLDESVTERADIEAMTASALMLFQHLLAAFEALWPPESSAVQYTVTSFNPESGSHPVTQNKQELMAVIRATDRCLADNPYFMNRFGKRGRRFSDADGAWLATLPEQGMDVMRGQVDWLGRLLSARGIPRLLLARHMEILARELKEVRPENAAKAEMLMQTAADIREKQEACFSQNLLSDRIRILRQSLNRSDDFLSEEAMELLASAVVDEANGVHGAVNSLLSWLADPDYFSRDWVHAIQDQAESLRLICRSDMQP